MAVRKLSLPLFSAKTSSRKRDAPRNTSISSLLSGRRRNQYALVCESQPLLSFGSHGLPAVPTCGAQIHSE